MDSEINKPIAGATLHILGRKIPFKTNEKGEFWRILNPGVYTLKVIGRFNGKTNNNIS